MALAAALRAAWVLRERATPVSDYSWYFQHAMSLARGLGYSDSDGTPTAFWPIGWPLVLAGVLKLAGPSVLAGLFAQVILSCATVFVIYLLARAVAGETAGLLGAAAYAILPGAILYDGVLGSEPLFTFLLVAAIYAIVLADANRPLLFALAGALLGFAALVRPIAVLFPVCLIVALAASSYFQRRRRRASVVLGLPLICAAAMAVVIAPVAIRNERVFGTFVGISNNGGINLWQGNNPYANGGYFWSTSPAINPLLTYESGAPPRTRELDVDRHAASLAWRYMRTHPSRTFFMGFRKVALLYRNDPGPSQGLDEANPRFDAAALARLRGTSNAGYFLFMIVAAIGFGAVVLRKFPIHMPAALLVVVTIAYFTLIFAVFPAFDRMRYPSMPLFAIFTGIGLMAIGQTLGRLSGYTKN